MRDYGSNVDRVMYIYSEESSKSEETVAFWLKGIEALCSDRVSFTFNTTDLSNQFIYKDMIPTSIENSIAILRSRKEIAERESFFSRTVFQNIASSAAGWMGSLFFNTDTVDPSKELIFVPSIRKAMDYFLQYLRKECEANHDQLLVVYACGQCDANNTALSFPYLVNNAGDKTKYIDSNTNSKVQKTDQKTMNNEINPENISSTMLQKMNNLSLAIFEDFMVSEGYAVRTSDLKILKILLTNKDTKTSSNYNAGVGVVEGSVTEVDVARLKLKSSILVLEKRVASLDLQVADNKDKAIAFKVFWFELVSF